ncbi:unnamed protein product [Vicia faba]|uniref:Uncharacterized protein n=1 Tax=Vicia faba TaxID=3906 RepID=A0AAV0ZFB8_VICFA|nr:unnamed protein product [Vicia faba]
MLVQKSRVKWLKEGDSNSGFFHKVMKERRSHNHIGLIVTEGGLLDSVSEIKEEVQNHFSNKFIDWEKDRLPLEGIDFKSTSMEDSLSLESPFQEEEIKEAI